MITANTAFTISKRRNTTTRNKERVRAPITLSDRAPIDLPLCLLLAHKAPISCTPAKKIVPKVTHISAGAHPQYTAIAGPTIGDAPATEVKWCPHSTYLLDGTKSTPSLNSWAGVLKSGSS